MIEPRSNTRHSKHIPLIGVTGAWAGRSKAASLGRNGNLLFCETAYLRCVEKSGGVPVLIPFFRDDRSLSFLVERLDGLLLTGGEDVHPKRFGQDILFDTCAISEERDEFEFRFTSEFLRTGKPILAICRGFQLVNVLMGGALIQDLPNQTGIVHHAQLASYDRPVHSVELREGCRLAKCFDSLIIEVNSTHHQAVEGLGDDLMLTGWSEEGIPEAFEHRIHPYLIGVQWHPERLTDGQGSQQKLFDDFVEAAKTGE